MDEIQSNINDGKKKSILFSQELSFGLNLSYWIIFPVIIGFFLGRYIVDKFNLPEYVFYLILIFFVLSSFYGLSKEILKYLKKLQKEETRKVPKNNEIKHNEKDWNKFN